MSTVSPEQLQRLRADAQGPDDDVASAAYWALCRAGDPAGIEIVIDRFVHPKNGEWDSSAEWALHTDAAFDTIIAVAGRDPGSKTAQWICHLLGEISCNHAVYPILPTLMRVLEASQPGGTDACRMVLRAFEYLSRKGPMPEAAPLLRAVLRGAAAEPDPHVSSVISALRALYVTEGDAIIPEMRALVAGLPESHALRRIVDNFIERREAGRPDEDLYPLPWETVGQDEH